MSEAAAFLIKKRIIEKPDLVLGLASGSTVLGLYQQLIRLHREQDLDFSKITVFNLDEYLGLPPSHCHSYHFYLWHNFLKHINIKKENVFLLKGDPENVEAYCRWYEAKIKEKGGIDLQILGIGRNGHLGFNEPGADFNSTTRVVYLDKITIEDNSRFFDNVEQVPKKALTMGLRTIMGAGECLLLASGSHKREIVKKSLKGGLTPKVPASILQKHKKTTVILDKEAAGEIIE